MRRIFVTLLVLAILIQPVLAMDVGITPDSPLYPIKRLLEEIDLFFTFDNVAKAEKLLKYAGLRLAEAKKMAEEGKYRYVDELLKDYGNDIRRAVELIESAKPKDASKIAWLVVNESTTYIKALDELSKIVPNKSIKIAEMQTIKQSELAIEILKDVDPAEAYKLSLSLTNRLLKIANERASKGENAEFLLKESEKLMNQSEEILNNVEKTGTITNSKDIVEEIKSIIDEATNISIIKNRDRNVTLDIIEKGLKIYEKLGIKGVFQ